MSSTRAALEAALAADPDDPARHAAYADLLIEEGDPRGEYVRLQLALEDRDQPADRLRSMEQASFDLLRQYENEWLGPLAPFVNPPRGPSVGAMVAENVAVTWRRGWVHRVEVASLTDEVRQAIAEAPLPLLQELCIRANGVRVTSRGATNQLIRYVSLAALADSPNVRNLRRLSLGPGYTGASFDADVGELVGRTPRLAHLDIRAQVFAPGPVFSAPLPHLHTLYIATNNRRLPVGVLGRNDTLGSLRRLHLDLSEFLSDDPADIEDAREPIDPAELMTFFRSANLRSLEYLALRMPGFGDVGLDELIGSGLLGRLKGLDLCRCDITDDGAQELAACPEVPRLEYVHLDDNYLTPIGVEALAAVGVTAGPQRWDGGTAYV